MHFMSLSGKSFRKTACLSGVFLLVAMATLAGCAPQAQPTAVPGTPKATQAAPTPSQPSATTTTGNPAWDQVVQAAKKEGKLTIYSYNLVGDTGIAVSRAFTARYGIPMDIITGRGAEFIERLKTEKRMGQLVADTSEGSALHIKNMQNEGLSTGVAGELPALQQKDIWVADPFALDQTDKQVINFQLLMYTPFVNTNVVKPGSEPKTWKDLLDPKWKGQMVITDPLTSGGPEQLFLPMLRENIIDENYIKALGKQDLRYASALPDEGGVLARGERALSVRGVDTIYSRFVADGAPMKAVVLTDATVASSMSIIAFKGSPHPNAAKVFINWLFSPEGQDTFGKAASASSIRKDVKNYLPPGAQVNNPSHLIVMSVDDNNKAAQLFTQHYVAKLLGRQ